jgi:hypothetical protein
MTSTICNYSICIETYNNVRLDPRSLIRRRLLSSLRISANNATRCPLAAEAKVRFQASLCELYSGQSGTGTGFSPSTSVFPVSIIPLVLHTHLHLLVAFISRIRSKMLFGYRPVKSETKLKVF